MTEEDTFNKLKRIPFHKMYNIYVSDDNANLFKPDASEYTKKLFERYGWTVEDYKSWNFP